MRRVRKIGNAHVFEALVTRQAARLRVLDEVLALCGGRAQAMMAQLAKAGRLTRDDLRELEETIDRLDRERKREERTR